MSPFERDIIGKALVSAAIFYDRSDFDKSKISLMISVLEKHFSECTAQEICRAIEKYISNPKNTIFPSPSRLQENLRNKVSNEDRALEIASRIRESVVRYGYCNQEAAKNHIGEVGWHVVTRFGGWTRICEDLGVKINIDTFYAQCRDLTRSQLNIDENEKRNDAGLLSFKQKISETLLIENNKNENEIGKPMSDLEKENLRQEFRNKLAKVKAVN
jgi:hypothetical protein